jgi:type IV pilus assembly protein PilB
MAGLHERRKTPMHSSYHAEKTSKTNTTRLGLGPCRGGDATIAFVVSSAESPSPGKRVLLGELLVQSKVITPEQLGEILSSPRDPGKKLGQMLLDRGWITEAQLTQTLSLQLSVPWVSLYHIDFSRQLLNRVSQELAELHCLIPIFVRHVKGQGETLYVAMADPTNEDALSEVSRLAGLPCRPMIASASDIRSAIRVYYGEPTALPVGLDMPMTKREGRPRADAPPPPTPAAATIPEPRRNPTKPPPPPVSLSAARAPSRPPPPLEASETAEDPPATTRSSPLPGAFAAAASEDEQKGRAAVKARRPRMLSLTLLDGTQIQLPAQKKGAKGPEALTARDFVSALRATAHGADASEILGDKVSWEPVVAALLSILLRKGLIADWEFVEELRKV